MAWEVPLMLYLILNMAFLPVLIDNMETFLNKVKLYGFQVKHLFFCLLFLPTILLTAIFAFIGLLFIKVAVGIFAFFYHLYYDEIVNKLKRFWNMKLISFSNKDTN